MPLSDFGSDTVCDCPSSCSAVKVKIEPLPPPIPPLPAAAPGAAMMASSVFDSIKAGVIERLRKELCVGCQIGHPNQRRHECVLEEMRDSFLTCILPKLQSGLIQGHLFRLFKSCWSADGCERC